jgi:hypothetical protein
MTFFPISAVLLLASSVAAPLPAVPFAAAAQSGAAKYSASQCESAKDWLVATQGRSPDRAENERQYAIWSSADCVALRQPHDLDVTPDIAKTEALLRKNGIDVEARMPAKIAACRENAPAALLAIPLRERAKMTLDQVTATCILNARTNLYAEALNALNAQRREKFALDQAEYERLMRARDAQLAENDRIVKDQQAAVAASQAEYEQKMAEWRRAVALCKKGKREYCAK